MTYYPNSRGSNAGNYYYPIYVAQTMNAGTGYTFTGGVFASPGDSVQFNFGCASQTTIKTEQPPGTPFVAMALIH